MGKLIEGKWLNDDELREYESNQYQQANGHFQRGTAGFRNWVTADGEAGPTGTGGFKAEKGRYHLFAAINCPWAHRTLIYRNVKHLQDIVGLSLVAPLRTEQGWRFDKNQKRFRDELFDLDVIHHLYTKSDPQYTGRATVPILWDKKLNCIVSNESAEIIRMFNSAFNDITGDTQDFCPQGKLEEINQLNDLFLTT